jgi:hypothetical protein
LAINQIPIHAHPANSGGAAGARSGGITAAANGSSTGNYGNSGAHAHPVTFTSASGPGSAPLDFRVQYIDVIICSFN